MSTMPGDKAKLVNFVDNAMSELRPLYSIEMAFAKSPKRGEKCGAIVVFKLSDPDRMDITAPTPQMKLQMESAINEQTDMMYRDPEYFKKSEGKWVGWAIRRSLDIFDSLGTNAEISIKCPKLKIYTKIPRSEIVANRSNVDDLFKVVWDIDRLLDRGFNYDPWNKVLRRGRIDAKTSKR